MKILMIASEAAPFARTGGLGDVMGALPKALAALGHEVALLLPRYSQIDGAAHGLKKLDISSTVSIGTDSLPMTIETIGSARTKVCYYFIGNSKLFGRDDLYRDSGSGKDFTDNDRRFTFFCKGALIAAEKIQFQPDIIHVHDWQAGLVPVYLKTGAFGGQFFSKARTVLTIHNLAYQGSFKAGTYPTLGLPEELFYATGPLEFWGKVNFLKGAIRFADAVTTVSESYAREIQATGELGCGLDGVLRERSNDLSGILNGVDYTVWSPSRDRKIPHRYRISNLSGKKENKAVLLGKAGLPVRNKTLLIGMISRLAHQKGFDLLVDSAERLFKMNLQLVILGTGERKYRLQLSALQKKYPDRLKLFDTFDDDLAHLIEAGSDMFLMPSRFEPCGLNQMYSLKYGTVPIVRDVGGLSDSIVDHEPESDEGTGFKFTQFTPEAMLEAVERASAVYRTRRAWVRIMKAGMRQDFSWDSAAQKYQSLYRKLLNVPAEHRTV